MTTKEVHANKLFIASCMALIVTAMSFAIRAKLMPTFEAEFGLDKEQVGYVAGTAFWGFTLAMFFGGPLVSIVGMRRIIWLALAGHVLGVFLTIFATSFWTLFFGTLLIGIGNGMVEAACNPLVTALYSNEKVKMLNRFHMWFPGGIVIGGLVAYLVIDQAGLGWKTLMAVMLVPAVVYAYLFSQESFPETERKSSGVTSGDMYAACLNPLFILMVLCMFMTAATELGTTSWIEALLAKVGVAPILLLVFINGIMAIGRSFAGPVVHQFKPAGMLLFSAVFSAIGLYWLSNATGSSAIAAAAVFAVGVCYFWPTMLGFVSVYLPRTGEVGLAIMGGVGMFSVAWFLPIMGKFMDAQIKINPEQAGPITLRYMAILPVILTVIFAGLVIYTRRIKSKPTLVKTV